VPKGKLISIPEEEQEGMLREIRRFRYGHLLALHILLLYARGNTPTEISQFLLCSRSSVYRTIRAYRQGSIFFAEDGTPQAPVRCSHLSFSIRRSLLALLKRSPQTLGWCRTRWSCKTLSLTLGAKRGIEVSSETMRRWLHQIGYVWKRAKLIARDDDPERAVKLARILHAFENLSSRAVMLFCDELDIHLLPKLGYEWMRKGEQVEVMTPGTNEKRYLAGALETRSGRLLHCISERKNRFLFLDLLKLIDSTYPHPMYNKIHVVADNFRIHKARDIEKWLSEHPRFELHFLPTYCPKANPIERAFLDVHDNCTRNHTRKRIEQVVGDVENHLRVNGPWDYRLSEIYYDQDVTEELEKLAA
jgi:putative transposase